MRQAATSVMQFNAFQNIFNMQDANNRIKAISFEDLVYEIKYDQAQ